MFLPPRESFPAPKGHKILSEKDYAGPTLEVSRDRAVVEGRKVARHNGVPLIYRDFYKGKNMFVCDDYYHHGTIVTYIKEELQPIIY